MSADASGAGRPNAAPVSPVEGLSRELFARRRDRILERLDDGAMILPAAPLRYRSRDTAYRYRPDSELFYVAGITDPGVVVLLRGFADEKRFVLFVRERDPEAERWTGPRPDAEAAAERYGADAAHPLGELEERLPGLVRPARALHYRLGDDERTESLVRRELRRARDRGARKGDGPRAVVDPGEILDELRLRKDPEEIDRIRRAADVTVRAFREALGAVRPGAGEWEIEAVLEASFRRSGARGPAFPTIVGSGANACIVHYERNEDLLEEGELVLIDGGADVGLYHGDVTRTAPVSGSFRPEQRTLYDLVEGARTAALDAVRPGATAAGLHEAALEVLVDGLIDLGILEGDRDELIAEEAHKPYVPHQTSHWLGLDVHDPGDYADGGASRELEPGMVLTIEPGLYVPEDAEGEAAPFAGTGVRIEDDVAVTADGHENLTAALPTRPDAVAGLVG